MMFTNSNNQNKRSRVASAGDDGHGAVVAAWKASGIGEDGGASVPPAAAEVSDDSSNDSSGVATGSTFGNHHHPEADTGSVGEAANDEYGGLTAEEYEYHMGMMNAMEDGLEDDDEGEEQGPGHEVPQEQEAASVQAAEAAAEAAAARVHPAAAADAPQNQEEQDAEAEEYEFAMGMMNAMEDGAENDPDDEFAMGMMNAMEDGEEEGFEDAHEEEEQEEGPEDAASGEEAGGGGGGFGFASLSNNIVQVASSVSNAVRDYYRMSQSDQAEVWDDMTGYRAQKRVFVQGKEVPGNSEEFEPREMVEEALKQLPLELQRMPSSHPHEALDLALEKEPHYVKSPTFLLKFLRAEKFDVFAAAVRMCRHFEIKLEIFGEEALGREITLDDLDEDDMDAFKSGYLQVLQDKDYGHRPVIFYYKAISNCYKKRENIIRAFWYMTNRMSEQEEIQKLGVSNVVYNIGGFPRHGMDYEKSRRLAHAFRAIPVRFNNFYVCLDDKPWLTVVETFAVMITRFLRVRLRMMKGTHEEVSEKLNAVGVPARALPVTEKSELIVDGHLQWIEEQREAEERIKHGDDDSGVNPAMDLAEAAEKNPFGLKGGDFKLQMDTNLAHLSDMSAASFYGRGPPSA